MLKRNSCLFLRAQKIIAVILLIPVFTVISACDMTEIGGYDYQSLLELMGKDKADVLESLGVGEEQAEVQTQGDQEEYTLDVPIAGKSYKATIAFYNDVFMAFEFVFDDINTAYQNAKKLRGSMETLFGEKTTYPDVVSNGSAYFDDVTDISEIKEQVTYYEDWTPATDSAQMEKMAGEREFSRIDMRFSMAVMKADYIVVGAKYTMIRDSL